MGVARIDHVAETIEKFLKEQKIHYMSCPMGIAGMRYLLDEQNELYQPSFVISLITVFLRIDFMLLIEEEKKEALLARLNELNRGTLYGKVFLNENNRLILEFHVLNRGEIDEKEVKMYYLSIMARAEKCIEELADLCKPNPEFCLGGSEEKE